VLVNSANVGILWYISKFLKEKIFPFQERNAILYHFVYTHIDKKEGNKYKNSVNMFAFFNIWCIFAIR